MSEGGLYTDNSQSAVMSSPWKTPDEVMKLHRLRMKKKALQARMNRTESSINSSLNAATTLPQLTEKRKNPFRQSDTSLCIDDLKKLKFNSVEDEASNDNTLFRLFNFTSSTAAKQPVNFSDLLSQVSPANANKENVVQKPLNKRKEPPIDWTLRTKVRFMSPKPFAWNQKLRTCEEASGITGYVRCLDTVSTSETTLDTSPNARFHQCCLIWQHPVLPWMELYPRSGGMQKTDSKNVPQLATHPVVKDSLHKEWSESFRSLFQLVRARQCPYFYAVNNTFTGLFRAAGICGHSEVHAIVTPTTQGFRNLLKDEDIEFTMPLKPVQNRRSKEEGVYDVMETPQASDSTEYEEEGTEEVDGSEEAVVWLHSMGVEASEIKKISSTDEEVAIGWERRNDKLPQSLVFIEGVEVQVLFNFLINCKSCIATTGPFAGVPPTLLSPVAFHGATLKPLKGPALYIGTNHSAPDKISEEKMEDKRKIKWKITKSVVNIAEVVYYKVMRAVRESMVKVDSDNFYSMEIRGPVLPTTVHNLCDMLSHSLDQFSLTFASQESTKAFSMISHKTLVQQKPEENGTIIDGCDSNASSCEIKVTSSAFGQVNLSDCGLPERILHRFCSADPDVCIFDSLKFCDKVYTWS